jgi:hypothetical protein
MSETLPRAIDGMSAADAESRVAAATEIHRIGRALADHAVFPWWSDKELSALLGGGNPFVTIAGNAAGRRWRSRQLFSGVRAKSEQGAHRTLRTRTSHRLKNPECAERRALVAARLPFWRQGEQ